jgi:transketolase
MKWAFQQAITARAALDDRIFLIIGDVGGGLFKDFRRHFPKRYFNAGLCEQSMVSLAAGMAIEGFRPVIYTITPFLIERAFEQVKLDVDVQQLPVGLVGCPYDNAGPTHSEILHGGNWPFYGIHDYRPETRAQMAAIVASLILDRPWFLQLKTAAS